MYFSCKRPSCLHFITYLGHEDYYERLRPYTRLMHWLERHCPPNIYSSLCKVTKQKTTNRIYNLEQNRHTLMQTGLYIKIKCTTSFLGCVAICKRKQRKKDQVYIFIYVLYLSLPNLFSVTKKRRG